MKTARHLHRLKLLRWSSGEISDGLSEGQDAIVKTLLILLFSDFTVQVRFIVKGAPLALAELREGLYA